MARTKQTGVTRQAKQTVVIDEQRTSRRRNKDVDGFIGISDKFAVLNKLITRDLNNLKSSPTFYLYTKDDIQNYLSNPYRYEKELD